VDTVENGASYSEEQDEGGRVYGWPTEVVHNRWVKSMKRNLTRETRHSDDSFTTLHHLKEEMESNQGKILVLQNESEWSNALEGDMESKYWEILTLKDKLQGSKTTLLNFHKEKLKEQRKEFESYKTKMEEYKDEKVNLKRHTAKASFFRDWTSRLEKFYSVCTVELRFWYFGENDRRNPIPGRNRVCRIVKIAVERRREIRSKTQILFTNSYPRHLSVTKRTRYSGTSANSFSRKHIGRGGGLFGYLSVADEPSQPSCAGERTTRKTTSGYESTVRATTSGKLCLMVQSVAKS
jgi:hypothetical protein